MSSPTLARSRSTTRRSPVGGPDPSCAVPRRTDAAPGTAGRYRYDPRADTWWWSAQMHAVLGLDPAVTAPCTETLVAAHHPDDGGRVLAALTDCGAGQAFVLETRVVRPGGAERVVVLQGKPARDDAGNVRAVEGTCLDVTGCRPPGPDAEVRSLRTEVAQLKTAMASRAAIEQAKGILMLLVGCGEQAAFDLLAHISSHTHRKIRDVAQAISGSAAGDAPLPAEVGRILRDACPPARPLP
ncbi:ANTAR domain-containing response regulator [Blastococcus saxobsidens]|uniref:Putative PAS/PAC sensor protein n=1 Tax=Blastococcus saxobsidens (strain DD2) TaxID=1146883 RepID=H6RPT3_BLASD|nr:ANTAR domain-containing protein [Blastococcus saxobsidens]CCG01502.1 putative PAS/PAC sensor protein [Blastococcus saxobsidens DD2]